MSGERNMMMYEVYPALKKWGNAYGLNINIVDLRWGITEEQAKDLHHTIKLCLQKVNEADPIFISFLGDRYGWPPEEEDFNSKIIGKNIDDYVGKDISATELEIIQALYNTFFEGTKKECLFFVRDLSALEIPDFAKEIFEDEKSDKAKGLQDRIKEKYHNQTFTYTAEFDASKEVPYSVNAKIIKYHPLMNFLYDNLLLADIIIKKIKAILIKKYDIKENEKIEINSNDYIISKYKNSYPVPAIDSSLMEMINNDNERVQGLFAKTGNGKTSAIARLIYNHNEYDYIVRFIQYETNCKNYFELAKSLAEEIKERYHLADTFEDRYEEHLEFINHFFSTYPFKKKLIIIVDGINESKSLFNDWILFFNCLRVNKLIYTCTLIESHLIKKSDIIVKSLPNNEIKEVVEYILKKDVKTLSSLMLDQVVQSSNGELTKAFFILYYLKHFTVHDTLNESLDMLTPLETTIVIDRTYCKMIDLQGMINIPGLLDTIMIVLSLCPDGVDSVFLKEWIAHIYEITNENYLLINIEDSIQFVKNFIDEFTIEVSDRLYITNEQLKNYIFESLYNFNPVQLFDSATTILTHYLLLIKQSRLPNLSGKDFANIYNIISYIPTFTMSKVPFGFFLNPLFLFECINKWGIHNAKRLMKKIIQKSRGHVYIEDDFIIDENKKEMKNNEDLSFKLLIRDMKDTLYAKAYSFLLGLEKQEYSDIVNFFFSYMEAFDDYFNQDKMMHQNVEFIVEYVRRSRNE